MLVEKSPSVLTPVVLDSWIINPLSGFLELVNCWGITTLSLKILSSKLLESAFLFIKEGSVKASKPESVLTPICVKAL